MNTARLDGRVAAISASTRSIGYAVADAFLAEGACVVIADLDQKVAQLYGMLHQASAATATVRCVFFIDPKRTLRAMIYYPLNVGRNFDEIVRVIDALQTVDTKGVACPANWTPGKDVIVPPPVTQQAAEDRLKMPDIKVTDWYFSQKKI